MILDAIIGFIQSLVALVVEGIATFFVPVINLTAAGIETLVGIFVSGFSLGRIKRKKERTRASTIGGFVTLLLFIAAFGWLLAGPKIMNRTVTFVARDGHSLPFAALIIHTKNEDQHKRTNTREILRSHVSA